MGFTIRCDKCCSEDVTVNAFLNDHDHIEIWIACRECGNYAELLQ